MKNYLVLNKRNKNNNYVAHVLSGRLCSLFPCMCLAGRIGDPSRTQLLPSVGELTFRTRSRFQLKDINAESFQSCFAFLSLKSTSFAIDHFQSSSLGDCVPASRPSNIPFRLILLPLSSLQYSMRCIVLLWSCEA